MKAPQLGEHVSVLGATGTGKTYWVREDLLPQYRRVIVLDTEERDFNALPRVSQKRAVALAAGDRPFRVRVVAFPHEDLTVLTGGLLEKGHDVCLYVDELTDFGRPGQMDEGLVMLVRKARKRNITVVGSTQRPALLDKTWLANSSHQVYFYLSPYDRSRVKDYAPFLEERGGEAPYKSYRYLYLHPNGDVTVEGPAT